MQGCANIEEEERRVRESRGKDCDMVFKNNIEGIILKWAYTVSIEILIGRIFRACYSD